MGVEFEEDSFGTVRTLNRAPAGVPGVDPTSPVAQAKGLYKIVMRMGLAKNEKQATIILIVTMLLFFGASVAIMILVVL
jgi:hypothetical protein